MPLDPIDAALSNAQQYEVMKRFRDDYKDALAKLEVELTEKLTAKNEADFIAQYIGEQAEVAALRPSDEELASLEQRRQHIGAIIERLEQSLPDRPEVSLEAPAAKFQRY